MVKLSDFDSFKSLCRERIMLKKIKTSSTREFELNKLITHIFSQEETNQYWMQKITEYLNLYDEKWNVLKPILINNAKHENKTLCLIISENTEVSEITSEDIENMKQGVTMSNFIVFDNEINSDEDLNDYYKKLRPLREVLQTIGLYFPIKFFLCEEIMTKLTAEELENNRTKKLTKFKKNKNTNQ